MEVLLLILLVLILMVGRLSQGDAFSQYKLSSFYYSCQENGLEFISVSRIPETLLSLSVSLSSWNWESVFLTHCLHGFFLHFQLSPLTSTSLIVIRDFLLLNPVVNSYLTYKHESAQLVTSFFKALLLKECFGLTRKLRTVQRNLRFASLNMHIFPYCPHSPTEWNVYFRR